MIAAGYQKSQLSYKQGAGVVSDAMKDKFTDLSNGLQEAQSAARTRATKEDEARTTLKIGTSHKPGKPSQPVPANKNPTYPEYLHELSDNGSKNVSESSPNENSFTIFFHISKLYFNSKQIMLSNDASIQLRPPSTIREMLYFLATLPYSPSYDSLNSYITEYFTKLVNNKSVKEDQELMIPVADSASPNTNNTLSAAYLKDYLTTTC
ncbi:variant erythrocyte surface antigen-1, beta subunit [Babesia caballi]|uniref:Variant erythrocyte surface antigen-1, beta subunit n=1 Tax=Babesia caballi TaxID=5871 RepID=A0AAV4LU25_BABCB|nr:variant erythrocyte surface antigen-1, beta subunit [Babesia caballi]